MKPTLALALDSDGLETLSEGELDDFQAIDDFEVSE